MPSVPEWSRDMRLQVCQYGRGLILIWSDLITLFALTGRFFSQKVARRWEAENLCNHFVSVLFCSTFATVMSESKTAKSQKNHQNQFNVHCFVPAEKKKKNEKENRPVGRAVLFPFHFPVTLK